jgi:hypothetical protein
MNGCTCDNNVTDIITRYIYYGWNNIVHIFKHGRHGKEKILADNCVNIHLLNMLSSVRIYIFDDIFKCANEGKLTAYHAFGSNGILSDYDISIVGTASPQVVWKMFTMFIKQYKNTSSYSFDTNMYCMGLYMCSSTIENMPECITLSSEYCIFQPITREDIIICVIHAFKKLVSVKNIERYREINSYIDKARNIHENLESIYSVTKDELRSKKNLNILDLYTKYKLYCNYAEYLYKEIDSDKKSIMEIICTGNHFAVEAYFTPCATNVVVFELQGGYNIKLNPINYLCSVIENLGDLLTHISHIKDQTNLEQNKYILLKYSKYIYRIYYSLGKCLVDEDYLSKSQAIKDNIIPFRNSSDIDRCDFELLDYTENTLLDIYINKFTDNIINAIILCMSQMGLE